MVTILYESPIAWDHLFQRPQQLMRSFARLGCRAIFYVGPDAPVPGDRPRGIYEVEPNLFVVVHQDPMPLVVKPLVTWFSYPPWCDRVRRRPSALTVFDYIDEAVEEFSYWAARVNDCIAAADIVCAISEPLWAYCRQRHPRAYLLPNAADYDHFSRAQLPGPVPEELRGLSEPVIGFYGALASWVELDWVAAAAAAHPEWSFALTGPRYVDLPAAPNICHFGHRDYSVLPDYLRGFAVAVLPFRISAMTRSSDPVKLYEYLASGKPVVASALPRAEGIPGVRTARNAGEFIQELESALREGAAGAGARIEWARANTWDHRARAALTAIQELLGQRPGQTAGSGGYKKQRTQRSPVRPKAQGQNAPKRPKGRKGQG